MSFFHEVLERRNVRCAYCAVAFVNDQKSPQMATRDHVTPRKKGGKRTIKVCKRCNWDKADFSIVKWRNKLVLANDPRADTVEFFIRKVWERTTVKFWLEPDMTIKELLIADRKKVMFCRAGRVQPNRSQQCEQPPS